MATPHFHLTKSAPSEHWPDGSWSVYQITGDQIADRIVRERVNAEARVPYYEGKVIARHSWCGYLGMTVTLADAMALIADATK